MRIRNPECQDCNYYDKTTGFCGVCMKKILTELKEGGTKHGDRESENQGAE